MKIENNNSFKNYIAIARPDNWFKNLFVLPGTILGLILSSSYSFVIADLIYITIGIFSICLITSANYTLNEYLDADFDKIHPTKKNRPAALGLINFKLACLQYIFLSVVGLFISYFLSYNFFIWNLALLVMGIIYNVKPFRSKEKVYIDVLSESINNPIRFMLGWHLVILETFPPISIIVGYWMGGAFLMSVKRLSEFRTIKNVNLLTKYRHSFKYYNEENLLISSLVYALSSSAAVTVFLLKYKIEFVLCLPLYVIIFAWYMKIGLQQNSVAQTPEKLYKKYGFITFVFFTCLITLIMVFINIPLLEHLIIPIRY